jgi:hypothetical protein
LEAAKSQRIVGMVIGQDIQSHTPSQLQVFCLVHDAHPAAQLLDDAVVRDGLPDELGTLEPLAEILGRLSAMVKLNWLRRCRVVKLLFSSTCMCGQKGYLDRGQELACFQHGNFHFLLAQGNTF